MRNPKADSNAPFNQPGAHRRALLTALRKADLREAWWTLLDAWENRRAFRWAICLTSAVIVLGSVFWFVFCPHWAQRNALRMARQWIEAGKPDYAAEVVLKSLQRNPQQPELWLLAAELAQMNRQRDLAIDYAKRAVDQQPSTAKYVLAWASAALQADKPAIAAGALATLPATELARSSFAQRLLGELRRRENNLDAAALHFENALKLDGPGAVNEVPLGLCLLSHKTAETRQRGRDLLNRWSSDREWGASALRLLLEDALKTDDKAAMARLAGQLLAHPLCTFGDMPKCLQALSIADVERFDQEISRLKKSHLASPEHAAQLIGWLNQIGRSRLALDWLPSLPQDAVARPPLVQAKAEALRCAADWVALKDCTATGDWGPALEFLRWTYGLLAAHRLGDEKQKEVLWSTLYSHALSNSGHAHFAGSLFYTWKMVNEAEALWWRAAGQSGGVAYESLGALARHYQVSRDAEGQYKVFARLHSLRPQDDDVANNYIFFAALTGRHEQQVERRARELMERHPEQPAYAATYAFVLVSVDRAADARRAIEPMFEKHPGDPAVQFAWGVALAKSGEKAKAEPLLRNLPPETLTLREVELIESLLGR